MLWTTGPQKKENNENEDIESLFDESKKEDVILATIVGNSHSLSRPKNKLLLSCFAIVLITALFLFGYNTMLSPENSPRTKISSAGAVDKTSENNKNNNSPVNTTDSLLHQVESLTREKNLLKKAIWKSSRSSLPTHSRSFSS